MPYAKPTRYRSLKHLFSPDRRINDAIAGVVYTGRSASRRYNGSWNYDGGLNFYWFQRVSVWPCFCSFQEIPETFRVSTLFHLIFPFNRSFARGKSELFHIGDNFASEESSNGQRILYSERKILRPEAGTEKCITANRASIRKEKRCRIRFL